MFSLKDVYLIKFKTHLKGNELLTDYTSKKNIPFNLKRVFLTGNVSKKSKYFWRYINPKKKKIHRYGYFQNITTSLLLGVRQKRWYLDLCTARDLSIPHTSKYFGGTHRGPIIGCTIVFLKNIYLKKSRKRWYIR